nr:4-hydroxybenzoyl-CoA reductase subunit alpha [Deltaproteobacteria bacterium]
MEKNLSVVGQRLPMLDAAAKATGTTQFTDDLVLPGTLHGKILRSPHAHAKIISIDTSRAEALPGVKGVVTGKDIPDRAFGIVPKGKDEHALARHKVRYIGDSVAAVCATDPSIAEEALELIRGGYEAVPAGFDPLGAREEGAPLVHEGGEENT